MSDWLFDEQGQQWLSSIPSLRSEFSAAIPITAFCTYSVKNLGFSRLAVRPRGTQVWLRPRTVAQPALAGALAHLVQHSPTRILVSWFDDDWRNELFGSTNSAISRILALTEREHCRKDNRFRSKPVDPIALASNHPLVTLRSTWSDVSGQCLHHEIMQLVGRLGTGRYTLAVHDPASDGLRLMTYGPGYEATAKSWVDRSEGQRLEDQVDHAFGNWVARTFRAVARSGTPVLEAVDAQLKWPQTGLRSYRYLRLIVPFTCGDHRLILSASVANDPVVCGTKVFDEVA